MSAKVAAPSVTTLIPENIPKIFEQAQVSTANHQKNFVALFKLHSEAATITEQVKDGRDVKLLGEKLFEDVFIGLVARALPVKKGATVVDRIVRFIAGYTKFVKEKAQGNSEEEEYDSDEEDNTSTRFIERLLQFLSKGFVAKDKTVRFRSVQTVAAILPHVGALDSRVRSQLREGLLERVHDKETPVRVQAVTALSILVQGDELDGDQQEALDSLLEVLIHDVSAEVRKAAMLNIPLSTATLPSILSRTRDVDPTIRRLVFGSVLEQLEHPKQLTIEQRELIVRNGLGDRENTVKTAAAKLIADWCDTAEGVIPFLSLFDLHESKEAELALASVLETRLDILDSLDFSDTFWNDLTPDKVFLARVFVEHCVKSKDEARLESTIPVMTALAFKIQSLYNELLWGIQTSMEENLFNGDDDELREERETELADLEFVLGEILKLTVNLDYADEIGRRKMFQLVKDMISQDTLPEPLVALCLDIIRKLSASERDLIRIVVEVIHELRDVDNEKDDERNKSVDEMNPEETPAKIPSRTPSRPPKPIAEMTSEEKEKSDAMDLRCLSLCIGMLERVNSTFEENSTLEGILGELIVPAVKRKEYALREKGLISLGLCCLIARRMAVSSFNIFLNQVGEAPEQLKVRVLQILFDIMMVHEEAILANPDGRGLRVVEFLTRQLEENASPQVQAILVTGLAKLTLSGMVADNNVIKSLLIAYINPQTADNQELRQCLSYFFPVFCLTSSGNQRRVQTIFMEVYTRISTMYNELEGDEEMVHPLQVSSLLVDWMDPQKAIEIRGESADKNIHVDLSVDIIKALLEKDRDKEDRKVLCQLLCKLYFPDDVDDDKIRTIKLLLNSVRSRRPLRDAASSSAFARFDTTISKQFEAKLEGFSEEDFRRLEYLKDLFEFLDDIIPDDDVDEVLESKRGRKRRSESVLTSTATTASLVDEDDYHGTLEPPKRRGKGPAKKRRVSNSSGDEGEEEDEDVSATPPAAAPTRTLPKRAVKGAKAAPVVIEIPDSEGDDYYQPQSRRSAGAKPNMRRRRDTDERLLDEEISELLEPDAPEESIIGSDEDSADEVDDLLG